MVLLLSCGFSFGHFVVAYLLWPSSSFLLLPMLYETVISIEQLGTMTKPVKAHVLCFLQQEQQQQ